MDDERALGDLEDVGLGLGGGACLVALDRRVDLVPGLDEVLHEGGELHGAVHLARGDDGADAAASREEAAIDEALQSLAGGGA